MTKYEVIKYEVINATLVWKGNDTFIPYKDKVYFFENGFEFQADVFSSSNGYIVVTMHDGPTMYFKDIKSLVNKFGVYKEENGQVKRVSLLSN